MSLLEMLASVWLRVFPLCSDNSFTVIHFSVLSGRFYPPFFVFLMCSVITLSTHALPTVASYFLWRCVCISFPPVPLPHALLLLASPPCPSFKFLSSRVHCLPTALPVFCPLPHPSILPFSLSLLLPYHSLPLPITLSVDIGTLLSHTELSRST